MFHVLNLEVSEPVDDSSFPSSLISPFTVWSPFPQLFDLSCQETAQRRCLQYSSQIPFNICNFATFNYDFIFNCLNLIL